MLTILYYIMKLISSSTNKLSNRIYNRLEYKKLCHLIWKNFNQREIYENDFLTGILLKKETCPTGYTTTLKQFLKESGGLNTKNISTTKPIKTTKSTSKDKNTPVTESLQDPIIPYIIPSGSFKISEILMPNELGLNQSSKEAFKASDPKPINNSDKETVAQEIKEPLVQTLSTNPDNDKKVQEYRSVRKQMYHRR